MSTFAAARRVAALMWLARRALPPDAARRVRRGAFGVALAVVALALAVGALAAFLATPIVAAVGEEWLIPLAVAVGMLGLSVLGGVAAFELVGRPSVRRRP